MAIEITDDDLAEPSIAFAKLIQVVQEGRRDTKTGFALTQQQIEHAFAKAMRAAAPDYGEELKGIKTAIQAIEQKPALGLTVETLRVRIQGACTAGNADAVSALKSAATDYKTAQGKEAVLLDRLQTASWRFFTAAAVGLLLIGGMADSLINQAMVDRILSHRERPVITMDVEKVAADLATQFHGLCAAKASGAKGR